MVLVTTAELAVGDTAVPQRDPAETEVAAGNVVPRHPSGAHIAVRVMRQLAGA
jgi:hypothetical protein